MKNKKVFVLLLLILILIIIGIMLFIKTGKPMRWAQSVNAEDIAKVELLVYPHSETDKPYKNFKSEEFDAVTEKINQCSGRFTLNPEQPVGVSFCYYITMKNGDVHTVANNGMELDIDGTFYTGNEEWLTQWVDSIMNEVDSPIPEDFAFEY